MEELEEGIVLPGIGLNYDGRLSGRNWKCEAFAIDYVTNVEVGLIQPI